MSRFDIFKCNVCGAVVEVEVFGAGKGVCCGKEMVLMKSGTTDGATEKHIPIIEKKGNGYLVKVGGVAHPMTLDHYIQWIEIITEDEKVYKQFLKPTDKPEVFFDNISETKFIVREYCNLHGLWESKN